MIERRQRKLALNHNLNVMTSLREHCAHYASCHNAASIYWSRGTDENFQELCNNISDGVLSHNPGEVALFGFASLYSKKWKLTGVKKVPHFIPNLSYIPKRSGKPDQRYILFLRAILAGLQSWNNISSRRSPIYSRNRQEASSSIL